MCGIFAYAGEEKVNVRACLLSLAHRGPDNTAILKDGQVTLGHCRLSIIDPDPRSNQPMKSASGRSVISFNGEIYNYRDLRRELEREGVRFKTNSDTEVILEGYERRGIDFFELLRGMWALVIHDRDTGTCIAVRDPWGIKPLYYAVRNGSIYFASEVKCLRGAIQLEPDSSGYDVFYNLGYFIAPSTPYKGVWKLRPGQIISWSLETRSVRTLGYVSRFSKRQKRDGISRANAMDFLDASLTQSVEAHYVADVPVSILLSGGNDSSLIAALSKKLGKKPTAYHIAIPGNEDTHYAEAVAKELGLELIVDPLTEDVLATQYEKIWPILDEPTGDVSIIPTSLVYERIKGKAKVVLSGEGGDELFGGYQRHALLARHTKVQKSHALHSALNGLLSISPFAVSHVNPLIQRTRLQLLESGITDDLIGAYLKGARTIDYPLEDEKLRGALYELYKQEYDAQILPSLAFDILAYLPNDLLPKSDLASMSSSIEARVPFVDRFLARDISIVQSILGPQLGIGTKGILKEVLTRYLPEKLVFRSKKGFGVPLKSYSFPSFRSDFDAACEFHLQNRDTFSVSDDIKKFIQKGMRNITMKKYPRFAFALVSNWKLFERK